MKISVYNEQRHKISISAVRKMAQTLSSAVLSNVEKNKPAWIKPDLIKSLKQTFGLNLVIVSKSTIRRLNKKWLGKDKATDVLSFPLLDWQSMSTDVIHSHNGRQELGDIFIAYEVAVEQAKEYKHSLNRELAFLFVHGMLHVLGFDHQNKTAEKDMFGRQRRILKAAGYSRSRQKLSKK